MITARRTRLVRVPDLHRYREAIAALCAQPAAAAGDRFVVVPTRRAASLLARTLNERSALSDKTRLVTRDDLYDALHARLADPPRRLTTFEREAMAQAAARDAATAVGELPFQIRPGLVAEMLRFYDQLRRQSQLVRRFEELITDALGGETDAADRGSERLLLQTRFLARAFQFYEQRVQASGAVDEHLLRETLIGADGASPVEHVVVTVADWIADPAGLTVADFHLLNRLPHLTAIDIVATEALLGSGFHERVHEWLPGIEEIPVTHLVPAGPAVRPLLVRPVPTADAEPLWFTRRDREEELLAVARRLATAYEGQESSSRDDAMDRVAVVFKRPLPYLYLAADTLGAARLPYVAGDALPLAAEPAVAPVDLVLDALETGFARDALVALLRSPYLSRPVDVTRESIGALNAALSDARYLGDPGRLHALESSWAADNGSGHRRDRAVRVAALPALRASLALAGELDLLRQARKASAHLRDFAAFLDAHCERSGASDPARVEVEVDATADADARAWAAVLRILRAAADAHEAHHDPVWETADLAAGVRRWIGDETFARPGTVSGIQLVDDQAARYGSFDDITIVGLVESEWPDRSRRTIFYQPRLLKALNWPSEKDRHAAAEARFLDLIASSAGTIELSTVLLDDEAVVARSILLDEVSRARLSTDVRDSLTSSVAVGDEQLAMEPARAIAAPSAAETTSVGDERPWLALRATRSPADSPSFHGAVGQQAARTWSVSALETYLGCPFKFYAQHVLRLEEEPDDEEVMSPLRQGQFVHEVFEAFFKAWQQAGHREISASNIGHAREMFTTIVDALLEQLPEGEAALERTRLLGSPAAAGLGEAVFRMEAERPIPVVARLLEHSLSGMFTFDTSDGPRLIALRGKADRLDLLDDGTFRLIDYKLGWPPDRSRALQLPIYAICAEQQLTAMNRKWRAGEAVYIAFKGPKRIVPLFATDDSRGETLARAQQRLADTIDAIERGEFPPTPDDVFRCETCSYQAVCRKDYVGDV